MSCQLAVLANFQDIKSIKKYLYPDVNESAKGEGMSLQKVPGRILQYPCSALWEGSRPRVVT